MRKGDEVGELATMLLGVAALSLASVYLSWKLINTAWSWLGLLLRVAVPVSVP